MSLALYAKSRWFQRFAIRTTEMFEKGSAEYQKHAKEFTATFQAEMRKGMEELQKEGSKQAGKGGGPPKAS